MESFASIISRIKPAVLAEEFGTDAGHIRTMRTRNSIPVDYWPALLDAAPRHGVKDLSWERLQAIRSARPRPTPAEAEQAEVGA